MKANELRIGNYYNQFGNIHQADYITIKDLTYAPEGQLWCKPIPLTEEWLIKFGAEVYEFDHKENQYRIENDLFVVRSGTIYHYGTNVRLDYVHTLQNLIFALRNKELTLKP